MLTKKEIATISFFVAIWRVLLFCLSFFADTFLPYKPSFPLYAELLSTSVLPRWLYSWANFDGVHYLGIAHYGYVGTLGLVQAFFPFFPYLILRTTYLLWPHQEFIVVFGIFLTTLFSFLLGTMWFAFTKQFYGEKGAWVSLFILFLFPTSFFFAAVYTESLFLLLLMGAFLAARYQRWGIVTVLVMCASATRIVGIFLVPALILECWQQQRWSSLPTFIQKHWQTCILLLTGSIGLLGYMAFLYQQFHDPLYFFHVQNAFGAGRETTLVLYPQTWWRALRILLTARPFDLKYYTYVMEFLAGTLGIIGVLLSFRVTRVSYAFFSLCAFLLPTLTGTFSSLPRYLLPCISIFLLLTHALHRRKFALIVYLLLSTFFFFINVVLFLQGYWVG